MIIEISDEQYRWLKQHLGEYTLQESVDIQERLTAERLLTRLIQDRINDND